MYCLFLSFHEMFVTVNILYNQCVSGGGEFIDG